MFLSVISNKCEISNLTVSRAATGDEPAADAKKPSHWARRSRRIQVSLRLHLSLACSIDEGLHSGPHGRERSRLALPSEYLDFVIQLHISVMDNSSFSTTGIRKIEAKVDILESDIPKFEGRRASVSVENHARVHRQADGAVYHQEII